MLGWTNIHTSVALNVASLERVNSTIYGKTTLFFVKDQVDDNGEYDSDDDDTVYCHLNCRQCKPLSASVQGLKTTLTHSDYLGTLDKPIVPENYKDLDVFDLRYRQKASASEVTAELVIAIPPSVLDNPEIHERNDANGKTQLLRVEVEYELSNYLFGLHRGHFVPNTSNATTIDGVGESQHVFTFNEPLSAGR